MDDLDKILKKSNDLIMYAIIGAFFAILLFGFVIVGTKIYKTDPENIETKQSVYVITETVNTTQIIPEFTTIEETMIVHEKMSYTIDETFSILTPSGYTSDELSDAFSYGNYKNFQQYVNIFIQAEQEYGVNALYLACVLGLESGWGQKTSGVNNIAGWTSNKTESGWMDFTSIEECILYVGEKLATTYVEAVGENIKDVAWRYCPSDGYLELLLEILNQRNNKIIENLKGE